MSCKLKESGGSLSCSRVHTKAPGVVQGQAVLGRPLTPAQAPAQRTQERRMPRRLARRIGTDKSVLDVRRWARGLPARPRCGTGSGLAPAAAPAPLLKTRMSPSARTAPRRPSPAAATELPRGLPTAAAAPISPSAWARRSRATWIRSLAVAPTPPAPPWPSACAGSARTGPPSLSWPPSPAATAGPAWGGQRTHGSRSVSHQVSCQR